MTVNYGNLRKGMAIELDDQPFVVVEYEQQKKQQRAPVMRIKFRQLTTGRLIERTFSGYDVDFTLANVDRRTTQFIYQDDNLYYFMDTESYEQFPIGADQIKDSLNYLVEQIEVELTLDPSLKSVTAAAWRFLDSSLNSCPLIFRRFSVIEALS